MRRLVPFVLSLLAAHAGAAEKAHPPEAPPPAHAASAAPRATASSSRTTPAAPRATVSGSRAAPTPPAAPFRARAAPAAPPAAPRTLEDIHIEGEIAVPQVLFITARDQRRFMDFQHRRYLQSALQVGEATAFPSRIVVLKDSTLDLRKENSP